MNASFTCPDANAPGQGYPRGHSDPPSWVANETYDGGTYTIVWRLRCSCGCVMKLLEVDS